MYTFYELQSKPYTFYVNLSESDENIYIHVGGSSRKCVSILVYGDVKEAVLSLLEFHESCSAKEDLSSGAGTVQMLRSTVSFLYSLYPDIKKLVFTDTSFIRCNQNQRLDLQSYYLVLHGKTWYESKFGAKPNKEYKKHYMKGKELLENFLFTKPSYDTIMRDIPKTIKSHLEKIYHDSTNLKEFINKVNEENDCIVFKDWLQWIVVQNIPYLYQFTWEIDPKKLKIKQVRIRKLDSKPERMFGGGGKFINRFI